MLRAALAVAERDDGRRATDAVPIRGDRRVVDVDGDDLDPADVLVGDPIEDRLERLAGRAPPGGEVDEDGTFGVQDLGREAEVVGGEDVLALGHAGRGGDPPRSYAL